MAPGTVRLFARGRIGTTINGARDEVALHRGPDGQSRRTFLPRLVGLVCGATEELTQKGLVHDASRRSAMSSRGRVGARGDPAFAVVDGFVATLLAMTALRVGFGRSRRCRAGACRALSTDQC
jgi:hypothetical protein